MIKNKKYIIISNSIFFQSLMQKIYNSPVPLKWLKLINNIKDDTFI